MKKLSRACCCFVVLSVAISLFESAAGQAVTNSIVLFDFSGSIQKIDGRTVTFRCVRPNPEQISIIIDERTTITLNGKKATVEQLKVGQTARVATLNGLTTNLDAKSK
jgi:hypothetical protein